MLPRIGMLNEPGLPMDSGSDGLKYTFAMRERFNAFVNLFQSTFFGQLLKCFKCRQHGY